MEKGWEIKDGQLKKDFIFSNFKDINIFLDILTKTILDMNHHPSIVFSPEKKECSLCLITHEANNTISSRDWDFAHQLEKKWDQSNQA